MAAKERASATNPARVETGAGENDRLTGALTERALEARAQAALTAAAGGEGVAIGYAGVADFAALNERYGSVVTDQLLREIATRIQATLRPQDSVGRVARDEFMIVFRGLASRFETFPLAAKIRTAIAEPMRAGTETEVLAPACGIAHYPANGKTVADLRDYAAGAMRTLRSAMRTAGVISARENIERARENVAAAQTALEAAERAYEEAVALAGASNSAADGVPAPELETGV